MAKDLRHQDAVRTALATAVRSAINNGTANSTIHYYTETIDSQPTGSGTMSISIGDTPFGAASSQAITYPGTATATNTQTASKTINSFAIFDGAATPVKTIKGTVGNATGTFDIEITGGNAIGVNEKIQLTNFVYTASV